MPESHADWLAREIERAVKAMPDGRYLPSGNGNAFALGWLMDLTSLTEDRKDEISDTLSVPPRTEGADNADRTDDDHHGRPDNDHHS